MVALAIGSFLIIGAVQIYTQSRQAFVVNESIARVQETAQFAMDTIEADLRMASNWGRNSRGLAVEGRSLVGDANPNGLTVPLSVNGSCGDTWAFDLGTPIDGSDNSYGLACGATGGAQATSDVVTVRRVTVQPVLPEAGRLQVQSTRIQGELFESDEEVKLHEHLEQCQDCRRRYRKLKAETEIIGSINPELPGPSIELPDKKKLLVSNIFKIAALLLVGFTAGYVTSEDSQPEQISVVPQYSVVSTPEDSLGYFFICESIDLKVSPDTSRTEVESG